MAVVKNPLSSDIAGDDIDQVAKIDAVDLNAEMSEFGKVQRAVGRWFATEDGSSSPQFRVAQLSIVLAAFAHLFDYGVEGDAKYVGRELDDFSSGSQTLMWVSMFGASVAFLCLLPILSSVQRALKTGGELDQLGAGTVKISADAARTLKRWRMVTNVFGALFMVVGSAFFVQSIMELITGIDLMGRNDDDADGALSAQYSLSLSLFIIHGIAVTLVGFWPTMLTGSALARDAISEVQHKLLHTDPRDKQAWDRDVAGPALALDKVMKKLSMGWSNGLLGAAGFCWGNAMNAFCRAINTEYSFSSDEFRGEPEGTMRAGKLRMTVFMTLLPLLLAFDVAKVSSQCDLLMSSINIVRMRTGEECNERITWLETSLMRLHHGQGLGFLMAGVVVDKRTLRNAFAAMVGAMSTVITALLALSSTHRRRESCHLSDPQLAAIQSVVSSFNASSCAYNVSLDTIMEM